MFKIVETIEKGNKELTVVPKRWEQCGTLFWPKKFAYKYQQYPESASDPNWMSIPCKTKRQGFTSFQMAKAELSKMLDTNESTTENEEQKSPSTMLKRPRRAVKVLLPKTSQLSTDLNDLAASCTASVNDEQENHVQQSSVHQTYYDNFTLL
ncbi:hypothetical protein JTB14_019500 [Gonioctena quinquepunctata]|nr:hypothetical protein JTB14_019500 [Gonioctena quinquepunctata]